MNISKYVDFYLVEKQSKKNITYYAIVMRIQDNDYVLQFLTKDRYDAMKSSLSN